MLTPLLEDELSSLYSLFDVNGEGSITPTEVEQVLASMTTIIAPAEAEALRNLMHLEGSVSRDKFLRWAQHQPELGTHQLLRDVFQLVDTDSSGWLSQTEISRMLSLLLSPEASMESQDLLEQLDRNGNGQISPDEFLTLFEQDNSLSLSLAELKRLKKTLFQISSAARLHGVTLVEVDCDLGAGTPGAGAGIELLKNAVQRQHDLRKISEGLIAEIRREQGPAARADSKGPSTATPYARHIETISKVMHDAADRICNSLKQGHFPLVLAGDHSTAASTIAGIRRAHPEKRLGVIWIDAHADIHSPFTTPSGNMHGMPLAIASRQNNLSEAINDPDLMTRTLWRELQQLHGSESAALSLDDLIYVGVRDTEAAEDITLATHAIPVIRTEEVRRDGAIHAANCCMRHLAEVELIYVSFDVDAMDSTICKGTGTPVPGGLWAHEAMLLLRTLLTDPRVCCWEICEINPHLDELNTLAELSLGIFRAGVEILSQRFTNSTPANAG